MPLDKENLIFGISEKSDGSMRLGWNDDQEKNSPRNFIKGVTAAGAIAYIN